MWVEVLVKMFARLGMPESISEQPKTMSDNQNFVLSLNMDFEMLCPFLVQSSEKIFERLYEVNQSWCQPNWSP